MTQENLCLQGNIREKKFPRKNFCGAHRKSVLKVRVAIGNNCLNFNEMEYSVWRHIRTVDMDLQIQFAFYLLNHEAEY